MPTPYLTPERRNPSTPSWAFVGDATGGHELGLLTPQDLAQDLFNSQEALGNVHGEGLAERSGSRKKLRLGKGH